ncbi:MAG: hypothetical protein OEY59_10410, partial [Deltaproteobacteria bacterium]|nr:hypothetical protein [Deltaproteobacteria bacterium]
MKWRNLLSLTLLSVAMMWVLSSCEESGTITPTTPTTSDDVTLSGSMSLSAPAASAAKQANKLYVVAPTDYKLYCVTFTNPPIAGEGNFDASGNFTVTLADAAGLAIGCFINEIATNKTVSTLTFDTGDTTNLSGGTTNTSTAMKSGTHTISINFDP